MKRGLAYVLSVATLCTMMSFLLVGCDNAGSGGQLPTGGNGPTGGSYTSGGGGGNGPGGGPGASPGASPGAANGPK